jgi:2-oxoisovalerate dehydrogenase E1 component alpha subunit
MSYTAATVQLLSPEGTLVESDSSAEYLPYIDALDDAQLREFHRQMVVIRRFDQEAANLQRQGELGLWVPSLGQEAAQVGSAFASRPQDHIFPSYREHAVARIRGIDLIGIMGLLRGTTHGGWNPADSNFHLYTLVLGSHTLHATGRAMAMTLDGATGTGDPETDAAVMVYFGDGASSQGDVSEAFVFAASYQAPGFGIPGVQIDGNDVLAGYAVTKQNLDATRSGQGPRFIEALTYRMGAHTSSDDPTKYRLDSEVEYWKKRDPIARFETWLRSRGEGDAFFADVATEADDVAADIRKRTLALEVPPVGKMFDHVYSEPHPVIEAQQQWLAEYEASLENDG